MKGEGVPFERVSEGLVLLLRLALAFARLATWNSV